MGTNTKKKEECIWWYSEENSKRYGMLLYPACISQKGKHRYTHIYDNNFKYCPYCGRKITVRSARLGETKPGTLRCEPMPGGNHSIDYV